MIGALVSFAVAGAFGALGLWGRRNAPTLVPATYAPERRAKDERSIRRGAISCLALAALFALFGVLSVVDVIVGA